jgi:hypothetical protein
MTKQDERYLKIKISYYSLLITNFELVTRLLKENPSNQRLLELKAKYELEIKNNSLNIVSQTKR